jgi:uncharacterized protein
MIAHKDHNFGLGLMTRTVYADRESFQVSSLTKANRIGALVDKALTGNIITPFASDEEIMIISLVRMPADGLRFQHQYKAGELDAAERDFELKILPLVAGKIERAGADLRVRGEIKSGIAARCDRCLNEVAIASEIPFDLFYTPVEAGAGRAGEVELHDRDLDFATYKNDEIELDDLVLEQIELSLPSRVLCREDCRGLCPQCGADLNREECRCAKPIDPRWQALADLKAEMEKKS